MRTTPDFPFYNERPVSISGGQWLFVAAAVALAFVLLQAPPPPLRGPVGAFIPAILFPVIPLASLAIVAGPHWTSLFRRVGWRDVLLMVGFGVLNTIVTVAAGALVVKFATASPNAALAGLSSQGPGERALFFARSLPQLVGEEVVTILPFLGLMSFLVARYGIGRRTAIVVAWLATAVLFGAMHLPTYQWNLVQSLVLIGLARLILTLPYLLTRNLWVSAGAHIVNDWGFFGLTLLLHSILGDT